MALKLIKGKAHRAAIEGTNEKSREHYLIQCLREEAKDPKFTDWERSFISSVARQVESGRALSEKQKQVLERIWQK